MFWGGAFLLTNLLFGYSFLKHFCERANFSPLGRERENLFQLRMALGILKTVGRLVKIQCHAEYWEVSQKVRGGDKNERSVHQRLRRYSEAPPATGDRGVTITAQPFA